MNAKRHIPWKIRFWKKVHHYWVNLAWDLTPDHVDPLSDKSQYWVWRANAWIANQWVPWWMGQDPPIRITKRGVEIVERTRKDQ